MRLLALIFLLTSCASFRVSKEEYEASFNRSQKELYKKIGFEAPIIKNPKKIRVVVLDANYNKNNHLLHNSHNINNGHEDTKHGTHIHGIVKMMLSGQEVEVIHISYTIKSELDYLRKLKMAVSLKPDVLNLSLVGSNFLHAESELIKEAHTNNTIVVVSSGNDGVNLDVEKRYPASLTHPNVITVASYYSYEDNYLTGFSNYGKSSVFIGAHGVAIPSLCSQYSRRSCYQNGTSQSTALISSAVAILKLKNKNIKYDEVKRVLANSTIRKDTLLQTGMFSFPIFLKNIKD